MLITCPECELNISDKAISCPHCGYPLKPEKYKQSSKRKRLPNGFGQISRIKKQNLRNPYRAMVTIGKDEFGKPICKTLKPRGYFRTYNDAYQALIEYNKNPYDISSDITIEDLYNIWSKEHYLKVNERTVREYKLAWKYCVDVYKIKLTELRTFHIKKCIEDAPTTKTVKNIMHIVFNLMLDYAVEYEMLDKNLSRIVKIDRYKKSDRAKIHFPFNDREMDILWNNTDDRIVRIILTACYSGWRPGELCDLRTDNTNIKEAYFIGGMKTKSGTDRKIPIHSRVLEFVRDEYKNGNEKLFDLNYRTYVNYFSKAMTKFGLNENHTPHDCRVHFVTMAKEYKLDEYAIKRIVGHYIGDLTENTYTVRSLEWLRQEIEKIK